MRVTGITETMSLVPAFELGVWNAWIFMLPSQIISPLILPLLYRDVWKDVWKRAASSPPSSTSEKRFGYALSVLFYVFVAYSVFVPLRFDTVWFYVGFCVYVIGVMFNIMAVMSFANTPLDKPVTRGIYRVSRNPVYFSLFLVCIGTGIACLSWIFVLGGTIYLILLDISVPVEERFCLEQYGDTYKEYMKRTPRWIGIPKSRKND